MLNFPTRIRHAMGLQDCPLSKQTNKYTRTHTHTHLEATTHIGRRMVRGVEEIASRPRVAKYGPLSGPGLALGLVLGGVDVVKGGWVWVGWGGGGTCFK